MRHLFIAFVLLSISCNNSDDNRTENIENWRIVINDDCQNNSSNTTHCVAENERANIKDQIVSGQPCNEIVFVDLNGNQKQGFYVSEKKGCD